MYKRQGPTGSSASNNPNWITFEQGKTSIPIDEFKRKLKKTYTPKYRRWQKHRPISDKFIPRDSNIQDPIPTWGNIINIDSVTDKKKNIRCMENSYGISFNNDSRIYRRKSRCKRYIQNNY